jgi:hypothetical protein
MDKTVLDALNAISQSAETLRLSLTAKEPSAAHDFRWMNEHAALDAAVAGMKGETPPFSALVALQAAKIRDLVHTLVELRKTMTLSRHIVRIDEALRRAGFDAVTEVRNEPYFSEYLVPVHPVEGADWDSLYKGTKAPWVLENWYEWRRVVIFDDKGVKFIDDEKIERAEQEERTFKCPRSNTARTTTCSRRQKAQRRKNACR